MGLIGKLKRYRKTDPEKVADSTIPRIFSHEAVMLAIPCDDITEGPNL